MILYISKVASHSDIMSGSSTCILMMSFVVIMVAPTMEERCTLITTSDVLDLVTNASGPSPIFAFSGSDAQIMVQTQS